MVKENINRQQFLWTDNKNSFCELTTARRRVSLVSFLRRTPAQNHPHTHKPPHKSPRHFRADTIVSGERAVGAQRLRGARPRLRAAGPRPRGPPAPLFVVAIFKFLRFRFLLCRAHDSIYYYSRLAEWVGPGPGLIVRHSVRWGSLCPSSVPLFFSGSYHISAARLCLHPPGHCVPGFLLLVK